MPILRTRDFPEPGGRAGKGAVLESHGCNYGLGFRGQVKECGSSSIVTRRVIVGCQLFHEPVLERHIDEERVTDRNPERLLVEPLLRIPALRSEIGRDRKSTRLNSSH